MCDAINEDTINEDTINEDTINEDTINEEYRDAESINKEIHMYKHARGRRSDTIISGLEFETKEKVKLFISTIKKKFGIGGCQKMIEDMDKDKPVFVFTGDLRDKIIKILVEDYKYDLKLIKKHG
jgi:translation initiation factor 1 (eIF-1/SUI1)